MTTSASDPTATQQRRVVEHFESVSTRWLEVYGYSTVRAAVIRDRHTLALQWIQALGLPPDAHILEIGCGAGLFSVSVAQLGYSVEAVDVSERMVDVARRHATERGVGDRMSVELGDVHALRYAGNSFDVVVALGVLPWLHSPVAAIREMARVTAPSGSVILSADNRQALHRVLDPRTTPALEPMNLRIKHFLEKRGLWRETEVLDARAHRPRVVDGLASQAGLTKVRSRTVGFGPFSLFGRVCLAESVGLRLHRRLQALADRDVPVIRSGGHQYMLLARRPPPEQR